MNELLFNETSMKKLKRQDCFLGLHFDFHADDTSKQIGGRTTDAMIQAIIDLAHPDFLQCDCKGHRGLSSYPTTVGYPAADMAKDALQIWRSVTDKNGVALFVHYSGVWDEEALRHHPEWAAINADGTAHKMATSVFGDYADRLLIPQLCELAAEYNIDGAWIDGDCWGIVRDYGERVLKEFTEKTGITDIPKEPTDQYFIEFNEFCRDGFKRYLAHYVNALHARHPAFQITSNWAFTSYMPEPLCANLDFMSGDVWGVDTVNVARFEARYMSQQGKPWDLMAWNVSVKPATASDQTGSSTQTADKPAIQIMQEAAVILAQGGAFQIYYSQDKDGAVDLEKILTAGEVAKFCRARQPYCFKAKSTAEIAILNSSYAANRLNHSLYAFWNGDLDWIKGVMQCMIHAQLPVDVVSEFNLKENVDRYGVIVIPEWHELDNVPELLAFARNGGSLIVIGNECAKLFEEPLGVKIEKSLERANIWFSSRHLLTSLGHTTNVAKVRPTTATVIDTLYYGHRRSADTDIAATVNRYGKGKIAGIYFDFGRGYLYGRTCGAAEFMQKVVDCVLPVQRVTVTGSHNLEVTTGELNGKMTIGLINGSGPHSDPDTYTFDEIPAIGPVTITIRCDKKPERMVLQPRNEELPFEYADGIATVIVGRIEIYEILVVFRGQ